MAQKPAAESLKDALDDLSAAREQARLKIHLLSMDARTKWEELEAKVNSLQSSAEHQMGRLADDSAAKARELAQAVRKFVEQR